MDNKTYRIVTHLRGYDIDQNKEILRIINDNMIGGEADLRLTTLSINGCRKFEEDYAFEINKVNHYDGKIIKYRMGFNYSFMIISHGVFPTKFFEAIENKLPEVHTPFVCFSDNYFVHYFIEEFSLPKICLPDFINPDDIPYHSQVAHSFFESMEFFAGKNNFDEVRIWQSKKLDSIPREHPKDCAIIWNPLNNKDPDLKIGDETLKKYFPESYQLKQKKKQEAAIKRAESAKKRTEQKQEEKRKNFPLLK